MGALLWLLGIVFIIVLIFWVAARATRLVSHGLLKVLVYIAVLAAIFTGLTWAVLGKHWAAQREFQRLCAAEAGYKVYKSVVLPEQYFNKYGNVDFKPTHSIPGAWLIVADRYVSIDKTEDVSKEYNISRNTIIYRDIQTNEDLAVVTTLGYGPLYANLIPAWVHGQECEQTATTPHAISRALKQTFLHSNKDIQK